MDRSQLRNAISRRIGDRNLVFFGTRGDDVEGVGDQPQLAAAFSLIGTHRGRSGLLSGSLEDICGSRVDLDSYDIDDELQAEAVVELRRQVMRVLSRPSVVFPSITTCECKRHAGPKLTASPITQKGPI